VFKDIVAIFLLDAALEAWAVLVTPVVWLISLPVSALDRHSQPHHSLTA
jgi:hypothetical protein